MYVGGGGAISVSGIVHCIKKHLFQSDGCRRIKHIKTISREEMTQPPGRKEDVQVFGVDREGTGGERRKGF